ncbi:hypothetical protein [Niabella hibiscisoli]|uniref:hypothetical protein n=1 Tax=Niabella hibiscisoli TaxID=1825928 RepID=UPI001F0CEACB|nr:hypothetical protein [Niabella hibiscisoli]MCH5715611.1 hypothetical protein [Niabella hibiscisoli]
MKTTVFAFCTGIVLLACSKENEPPQIPDIDYSIYKPKTIYHSQRTYSGASSSFSADTSIYIYSGTSINYLRYYNGLVYDYRLTLENGLFTQVLITNNAISPQKSITASTQRVSLTATGSPIIPASFKQAPIVIMQMVQKISKCLITSTIKT